LWERRKILQRGLGQITGERRFFYFLSMSERLSLQRLLKINVVHSRTLIEKNGFAQTPSPFPTSRRLDPDPQTGRRATDMCLITIQSWLKWQTVDRSENLHASVISTYTMNYDTQSLLCADKIMKLHSNPTKKTLSLSCTISSHEIKW